MDYTTDATAKFLIMGDIVKRAKELAPEIQAETPYTFCAGHVGFRYPRKLWREAKAAGFEKTADRRWIGWVNSSNGEMSALEIAYERALREKKDEIASTGATASFLDNVRLYTY